MRYLKTIICIIIVFNLLYLWWVYELPRLTGPIGPKTLAVADCSVARGKYGNVLGKEADGSGVIPKPKMPCLARRPRAAQISPTPVSEYPELRNANY